MRILFQEREAARLFRTSDQEGGGWNHYGGYGDVKIFRDGRKRPQVVWMNPLTFAHGLNACILNLPIKRDENVVTFKAASAVVGTNGLKNIYRMKFRGEWQAAEFEKVWKATVDADHDWPYDGSDDEQSTNDNGGYLEEEEEEEGEEEEEEEEEEEKVKDNDSEEADDCFKEAVVTYRCAQDLEDEINGDQDEDTGSFSDEEEPMSQDWRSAFYRP